MLLNEATRAVILKLKLGNTQVSQLSRTDGPSKKKSTAVTDHMLMWDQLISFDDFKVLSSSNSEFHLKFKESLLISRDHPILNKSEASLLLYMFD